MWEGFLTATRRLAASRFRNPQRNCVTDRETDKR
jgi:hypothetical protein